MFSIDIPHTTAPHQDDRRARQAMRAERLTVGVVVRTPYIDGTRALMVRASDQYADRVARRIDPTAVLSHRYADTRSVWSGMVHVYRVAREA